MRVAFLIPNYYEQRVGGAEYRAYLLAKHLQESGHDVHYIFIDNHAPFESDSEIHLVPIARMRWPERLGTNTLMYRQRVIKALDGICPDIVYQTHGCAWTGIAAEYCRSHKCKMVWHIASSPDVEKVCIIRWWRSPQTLVERRWLHYGICHSSVIVGQAHYQDKLLGQNFKRSCDAIVPNWHPYPPEHIQRARSPVKVLWIANIKPSKQPKVFIRLAARLCQHVEASFIMAGRAGGRIYQRSVEKMLARASQIDYRGELRMADVNALLAKSHILVSTSQYEGFSNTFIQAWMRGVPVVSLNVDPDDVIARYGLGYHSHTFDRLCMDTRRLIQDPQLRDAMGEAARKYAFENHSLANLSAMTELFRSAALSL